MSKRRMNKSINQQKMKKISFYFILYGHPNYINLNILQKFKKTIKKYELTLTKNV